VGPACANKLRKLLAAERIELAEGGAFALIALERVVAFPAEVDTRLQAQLPDFTRESPGDRPEVADSVVGASGRANPHQ
jgi:hypothetical protein